MRRSDPAAQLCCDAAWRAGGWGEGWCGGGRGDLQLFGGGGEWRGCSGGGRGYGRGGGVSLRGGVGGVECGGGGGGGGGGGCRGLARGDSGGVEDSPWGVGRVDRGVTCSLAAWEVVPGRGGGQARSGFGTGRGSAS